MCKLSILCEIHQLITSYYIQRALKEKNKRIWQEKIKNF